MKKKWIISIEKDYEEIVKSKLLKMNIEIIHELLEIGVFTLLCSEDDAEKIKNIKGILSVEQEGGIQMY